MPDHRPRRLLFVCLGNICRSPSAEGLARRAIAEAGLDGLIETDSAGTGDWHAGEPPDLRATAACAARGVDISDLRARQAAPEDFERFDRILAMDASNLANLRRLSPGDGTRADLAMMLDFGDAATREVPDPYYGGSDGFEHMLDLLETAVAALIEEERRLIAAR